MKYDYDREADVLTITLSKGNPDFGEQSGSIITHYSKEGKPIEIEILDASETTLSMIKPILSHKKSKVTA